MRPAPPPELQPEALSIPSALNRVDFQDLEYVEGYDENLMCAICHCPFVSPVRLDCDHVFCQSCVHRAMEHSESCPTCRKRSTEQPEGVPVPKLIQSMLDGLLVKCPLREEGCTETMTRGSVQDHIDQYCDYTKVKCPWERCTLKARRKDAKKLWCQHSMLSCRDCRQDIMERDLDYHREKLCEQRKASCPHCKQEMLRQGIDEHINHCPDATFPCDAAPYGCDFIAKRELLNQHLATCPLHKLSPFLIKQKASLEAHDLALQHLTRKNTLMQQSLANIQEVLSTDLVNMSSPSGRPVESAPFDSTAAHLLSLHESLRTEVERVSSAVSELDARANVMMMNESLRNKKDVAHTNAALSNVRMQLHWLMSAKLQSQQRAGIIHSHGSSSEAASSEPSDRTGGGTAAARGATNLPGQPVRMPSDSTRQDTKL
ncbi:MAG: hypothetical protein Q9187_007464 [Circinaria calcarea]